MGWNTSVLFRQGVTADEAVDDLAITDFSGELVGADGPDEGGLGSQLRRGDSLVGALAAGQHVEGAPEDRLAGARVLVDRGQQVGVDRPDDHHTGPAVRCGWSPGHLGPGDGAGVLVHDW